jgi:catechol-2,3-dioxygenase
MSTDTVDTPALLTQTPSETPVSVSKLGFHAIATKDVEAIAAHYETALNFQRTGSEDGVVFLTPGGDHHSVRIESGEQTGRAAMGFEVRGGLDDVATRLGGAGIEYEERTDPEPGIGRALVIAEIGTGTPISLYETQQPGEVPSSLDARPTKIGHVASYVTDLAACHEFYLELLGFRWSDTIGDFFSFLRCNKDHHAINLLETKKKTGLFHVAYEMRDFMHMKEGLDQLALHGHRNVWGPGRHGVGHNIFAYHEDPDGNLIELFTEVDIIADEESGTFEPRPWHEEWPQGPKFWTPDPGAANKWGWINPDFVGH